MKFEETSQKLEQYRKLFEYGTGRGFSKHLKTLGIEDIAAIKSDIQVYYFDKEWGLKLLARNVFGISYTCCRTLFVYLGIEFRTGTDVVTKTLKIFRKEKADFENESNIGFNNDSLKRYNRKTSRGINGYYYNKSTNAYVWLRSSYEYIYAKFLNRIGVNWKSEETWYKLSDGSSYMPDFFIYDADWKLKQIIEIKGYFDCRAYKPAMLKEEYFGKSEIEVILIQDIEKYIETNSNKHKESKEWKLLRKLKESLSNELS